MRNMVYTRRRMHRAIIRNFSEKENILVFSWMIVLKNFEMESPTKELVIYLPTTIIVGCHLIPAFAIKTHTLCVLSFFFDGQLLSQMY